MMNPSGPTLFTIGYAGFSISDFIGALRRNGIQLLVDIRENPFSRMKDFSAKNLSGHLASAKLEYLHLKQLGCPAEIRRALKESGDFLAYKSSYGRHLETQIDTLNKLHNLLQSNNLCLMCLEQDETDCHRLIVAERLAEIAASGGHEQLKIVHLK